MRPNSKSIRKYIITSLAMSMVAVIWIMVIDAFVYGTWHFLMMICSITIFTFILCLVEMIIKNYLEKHFVLSLILEFMVIAGLFFGFGILFGWYPKGKAYWFFIYAIPIYAVSYFLRLVGIQRNAEIINKHLEARKKRL